MIDFKRLSFTFALALGVTAAGCAAQQPGTPGTGDGSGSDMSPGTGTGSGSDPAPRTLDATGKYQLASTYDIAQNMPGTVGTVVNDIIAATNGPNQPTQWVLDQLLAQMQSGTLKSLLQSAEPFVAGYLNDQLLSIAPDFVTTILQVGNDFGDMAKHFGINTTFDVSGSVEGGYVAVHTATGVHFKVEGTDLDFAFADYQLPNVVVNNVAVSVDQTGKMTIADHKLPLSYGKVLRIGLDNAIIPLIDPNATDLGSLFADYVDCGAVGQAIDDAIYQEFGIDTGAGTWQAACSAGLSFAAQEIYTQIDKIDSSALEFEQTGTAKAVDKNADGKVDTIMTGKWSGTLSYAGSPAPLASATFNGTRM